MDRHITEMSNVRKPWLNRLFHWADDILAWMPSDGYQSYRRHLHKTCISRGAMERCIWNKHARVLLIDSTSGNGIDLTGGWHLIHISLSRHYKWAMGLITLPRKSWRVWQVLWHAKCCHQGLLNDTDGGSKGKRMSASTAFLYKT